MRDHAADTAQATAEILAELGAALGAPDLTLDERRAAFSAAWRRVTPPPPAWPEPERLAIPRPDGSSLEALAYPASRPGRPAVLYFHGGGLTTLSAADYDAQSRTLAQLLDAVIVTPDFRLAPENPFPAAWEDAQTAYGWLLSHGESLGADPSRIVVMGDSGGGCLAAAVSQEAVRRGLPAPAAQVLIYPMLDMVGAAPSRFDRGDWVTHDGLAMIGLGYAGSAVLDPRVSPLREPSLAGQCPAFILTTDLDPLLDEGRAYALRLRAAGVPVAYFCYEGQTHGFVSFGARIPEGEQALRHIASWVQAILREPIAPAAPGPRP